MQSSFLVLPGVMVGHQKRELESLLLVKPRVAEGRVIRRKVVLVEPLAAAQALGDGIARELEVDAAEVAALLLVDAQRLLELAVDVVEAAGLYARGRGEGVAVHGVALPDDAAAVLGVLDGADVRGEQGGDFAGAVAGDEGDFAGLAGGVEGAEQGEEVLGGRGRADLDADGVGDAAEELDVGVVELARAVADPDEVSRGVVVLLGFITSDGSDGGRRTGRSAGPADAGVGGLLHEASQGLLVLEQEALVAGVELDGLELAGAGVDDLEEAQGLLDAGGDLGVLFLEDGVADVAQAPVERSVEVSNARGEGSADVVERSSRVVVCSFDGC